MGEKQRKQMKNREKTHSMMNLPSECREGEIHQKVKDLLCIKYIIENRKAQIAKLGELRSLGYSQKHKTTGI